MRDDQKTKAELLQEVETLRCRVAELKQAKDATEHKKAGEEIKRAAEEWGRTFNAIADLVFIVDKDFTITKMNKALPEALKLKPKDIIGKKCYELLHKSDKPWPGCPFEKTKKDKEPRTQEVDDPNIGIPLLITTSPIFDDKGKLVGALHIAKDITEHKRAEEALRVSQQQKRAILDSIPDLAWLKDKEGIYIAANEPLCQAFGMKLEDLIGKTDFDISPEDLAERYRADDQEVMKSGKRKRIEEPWGKKKGERIWIETIKTPIYNNKGEVIGTSGIARDITERKQAEDELSKYREKMARAEQLASLGTLSATIAHRLNSPLTAIRLSIENSLADLETTSCPDTVTEDLKDGLSGVSEVVSIVDSFRDFARKSSEKIVSQVDVKAVAEKIVKLLIESARRGKVSLHLKGMDELPAIYSNEKDLEQLFFALIDNAIQAADGKKSHQLIIDGAVKDKQIELRFADDCGGIAAENLGKIFEPFFTTRPAGEGTGLGLCVVEHIVSRVGGKIHVASKAGEGSTFLVTLPIKGRRS